MEYIKFKDVLSIVDTISSDEGIRRKCKAIRKRLKGLPTEDVEKVVRCKDCEHLRIINGKGLYAYCPKTECKFEPFEIDTRTHYCSFGIRKEGVDNG